MIQLKNFIEKVSFLEGKRSKDVVLSISDARLLRDEISKLLIELNELKNSKREEVVKVQISGGTFK